MTEHIRTGVIGYGLSGRVFHAPLLAADGDYRLDVIVTGDPSRADDARGAHPGAEVVPNPDEFFERAGDLDLVVIATSNASHAPLAHRAMELGLAVVVDKPFAVGTAEGAELLREAQERGNVLTVFQNRRWDGDFLTVRALAARGELGEVFSFESRMERWRPTLRAGWKSEARVEQGGGVLYDLGPHLIDQAMQLFGPVSAVHAEIDTRGAGRSADDDVLLSMTHESGVRSRLSMSTVSALPTDRFRVRGTSAAFVIGGLDPQEQQLGDGVPPTDPGFGRTPESAWGLIGAGDEQHPVETLPGDYPAFYRGLAEAIRGEGPLPVDPADSLEVLAIIEEAHASAEHSR
ncbi:oxidoreductase [Labedella phragmitis]|uniref:Oxidoreductase n=1 Tax=Labedella phragmitis TaxID=2498849 RepID=A0A3S4ADX0_9MICO|nr:Gfo/Idh/MocA family oxidoreductase [Labedella phragmitis]RWZ46157.1 oxidoreductase [Labedella phragmitis]